MSIKVNDLKTKKKQNLQDYFYMKTSKGVTCLKCLKARKQHMLEIFLNLRVKTTWDPFLRLPPSLYQKSRARWLPSWRAALPPTVRPLHGTGPARKVCHTQYPMVQQTGHSEPTGSAFPVWWPRPEGWPFTYACRVLCLGTGGPYPGTDSGRPCGRVRHSGFQCRPWGSRHAGCTDPRESRAGNSQEHWGREDRVIFNRHRAAWWAVCLPRGERGAGRVAGGWESVTLILAVLPMTALRQRH